MTHRRDSPASRLHAIVRWSPRTPARSLSPHIPPAENPLLTTNTQCMASQPAAASGSWRPGARANRLSLPHTPRRGIAIANMPAMAIAIGIAERRNAHLEAATAPANATAATTTPPPHTTTTATTVNAPVSRPQVSRPPRPLRVPPQRVLRPMPWHLPSSRARSPWTVPRTSTGRLSPRTLTACWCRETRQPLAAGSTSVWPRAACPLSSRSSSQVRHGVAHADPHRTRCTLWEANGRPSLRSWQETDARWSTAEDSAVKFATRTPTTTI